MSVASDLRRFGYWCWLTVLGAIALIWTSATVIVVAQVASLVVWLTNGCDPPLDSFSLFMSLAFWACYVVVTVIAVICVGSQRAIKIAGATDATSAESELQA